MGKKYYDIADDIKRLLLSDLREQKQRQMERRITDFIFGVSDEQSFGRLLAAITTSVSIATANKHMPWAEALNQRGFSLMKLLSERIAKEEKFSLIIRLWSHLGQQSLSKKYYRDNAEEHAIMLCCGGFYEYIGATLERSVRFALFLLELFAQATQERIDGFRQQSTSYKELDYTAYMIIAGGLTLTPGMPERQWLDQLIEHMEADETVWETWNALLRVAFDGGDGAKPNAYIVEDNDNVTSSERKKWLQQRAMCISNKQIASYRRVAERVRERVLRVDADCQERLQWLAAHKDVIARLHAQRLQAIREHARRGLRPDGIDHIQIDVTLLKQAGFRSVAFYPEGFILPNTKFHVFVKEKTPHLILFRSILCDGSCGDWRFFEKCRFPDALPLLHTLFEYVLVDILYRLTTESRAIRPDDGSTNVPQRVQDDDGTTRPPIHVFVAPYKRNLPAGQRASDEAKALALKVGLRLEEGETCVSNYDYHVIPASYRGGKVVYQLPTEPTAIYGDDDLLKSIEESI